MSGVAHHESAARQSRAAAKLAIVLHKPAVSSDEPTELKCSRYIAARANRLDALQLHREDSKTGSTDSAAQAMCCSIDRAVQSARSALHGWLASSA